MMCITAGEGDLRMPMSASPAAAGLAWSLVEQRLITWGVGEAARYDAHLVLSELVANAVAATAPGECISVQCRREACGVVIGVADPSPEIPRDPPPAIELEPGDLDLSEANWDDNGGWGLSIVKSLSADCGVHTLPSGGKVVWSRLRV